MSGTRVEQHLRAGGRQPRPRRGILLAGLGLALLAVVGIASDRPLWRIGGPPELISPRSYAGDLFVVLFGLLAVAPLIVRAVRGRGRGRGTVEDEPDVPPIRPPWWLRIVAALAVAVAVMISLLLLTLLPGSGPNVPSRRGPPAPPGTPKSTDGNPTPVHWWGIAGLVLVLLAGAGIAWRLRARPTPPRAGGEDDDTAELVEALDLSLEELEDDPDPRRAVIRAYARMERALGAAGLPRVPSETPLEYLARALGSLDVGRASVSRLTALHERAEYSDHDVDSSMKREALAALGSLREELAGARA